MATVAMFAFEASTASFRISKFVTPPVPRRRRLEKVSPPRTNRSFELPTSFDVSVELRVVVLVVLKAILLYCVY
jgi:hypothetical protein